MEGGRDQQEWLGDGEENWGVKNLQSMFESVIMTPYYFIGSLKRRGPLLVLIIQLLFGF